MTERGKKEIEQLGQWLRDHNVTFDSWYVSPQKRARVTSEILRSYYNSPCHEIVDDRLQEIFCGSMEGKKVKEMPAEVLHSLRTNPSFPYPGGGESMEGVIVRSSDFLRDLTRENKEYHKSIGPFKRVVIVSHGNLNRGFAVALTGVDPMLALRIMQTNTGFSRFTTAPEETGFRMLSWNETPHLSSHTPDNIIR